MKIGILTFHCAHNYGAVLQAYATQEYLKSLGHEAFIINDIPSFLQGYKRSKWQSCIHKRNPFKTFIELWNEAKLYKIRRRRWDGFNDFINYRLNLTTEAGIPSDLDAYIVGSDQVWNYNITKGYYPAYFCNFPFHKEDRLYIAYAASMENHDLTQSKKQELHVLLKNFDSIGVREREMIDLLSPLVDKKIHHTIDPTLLASKNIWENLVCDVENLKDRYVLLYKVWSDRKSRDVAERIAAERKCKVIELVSWLSDGTNLYQAASPEEFVSLIKNAECVVTDSFHGTSFSLIFNKDFYFVKLSDKQNRAISLLQSLGLGERVLEDFVSINGCDIDYNEVNEKLSYLQKTSRDFLNKSLDLKK